MAESSGPPEARTAIQTSGQVCVTLLDTRSSLRQSKFFKKKKERTFLLEPMNRFLSERCFHPVEGAPINLHADLAAASFVPFSLLFCSFFFCKLLWRTDLNLFQPERTWMSGGLLFPLSFQNCSITPSLSLLLYFIKQSCYLLWSHGPGRGSFFGP